ncbi:MAG: hypothetical protein V4617_17570 [Gemmatimonadota bacterium]
MQLTLEEIRPGVVAALDTTILRGLGGSLTNAVSGPEGDRAVVDVHRFLVVHVDAATATCTAVPLYDRGAVGNQPLDDAKKSGPGEGWIGAEWFFSRWQHWRIPLTAVVEASVAEDTNLSERRSYATADRSALDDIRVWESRNRAAYRPV